MERKVYKGKRGGKYVIVKGRKKYLSSYSKNIKEKKEKIEKYNGDLSYFENLPLDIFTNIIEKDLTYVDMLKLCNSSKLIKERCNNSKIKKIILNKRNFVILSIKGFYLIDMNKFLISNEYRNVEYKIYLRLLKTCFFRETEIKAKELKSKAKKTESKEIDEIINEYKKFIKNIMIIIFEDVFLFFYYGSYNEEQTNKLLEKYKYKKVMEIYNVEGIKSYIDDIVLKYALKHNILFSYLYKSELKRYWDEIGPVISSIIFKHIDPFFKTSKDEL